MSKVDLTKTTRIDVVTYPHARDPVCHIVFFSKDVITDVANATNFSNFNKDNIKASLLDKCNGNGSNYKCKSYVVPYGSCICGFKFSENQPDPSYSLILLDFEPLIRTLDE